MPELRTGSVNGNISDDDRTGSTAKAAGGGKDVHRTDVPKGAVLQALLEMFDGEILNSK
ncbi:MAG: hypothetical protein FWB94_11265 [Chitinispirillia bacterium]|nr:hypothetical protein [Chitinispirillia bacterium]